MNHLKPFVWTSALALVALTAFLLVSTRQALRTATTMNQISFNGQGKVSTKPDIALAEFSIVTQAATAKAAQDQNSQKSRVLADFIKKQGVDEKDFKTSGYNIHPTYSYTNNRQRLTGYSVTQTLELKIRDFDKASALIDGIVDAGVNQVNQMQFVVENSESAKNKAREAAIADAKAKASRLAAQLGLNLTRIVNYSENDEGRPRPMMMKNMVSAEAASLGPALPIGENEFSANVTITYQIE